MRVARPPARSPAALAALAALIALAAAEPQLTLKYETTLQKGVEDPQLNEPQGPFYIPAAQCSGVLDAALHCADGGAPKGVRVHVVDFERFPRVLLDDTLRHASVLRAPPCAGEARVEVQLGCPPRA